jgi:hypothetical protein
MTYTRRSVTWGLAATGLMPHIPRAFAQSPMKLTLAHNVQPMAADDRHEFGRLVAARQLRQRNRARSGWACRPVPAR